MFKIIISSVVGVLVLVSGWLTPQVVTLQNEQEETFGAQLAVGGEVYSLSGSGISSSATSIGLTKFGYTQPNGTYQKFTMPNFGDLGCITIQPGNASGKQEFASFTGITQNGDGTATLSGVTRGLERYSPYSASTTLQTAHAGGSQVVVSNSPPCFYQSVANLTANENVTGLWQFTQVPYTYGTATSTKQFATREYANSLAVQGAATSTINTSGIGLLATGAQAAAGTYALTSPYFLSTLISTSTWFSDFNNMSIITKTNDGLTNTIDSNFLPRASAITWSGANIFSGQNIFSATNTFATTTFTQITAPVLDSIFASTTDVLANATASTTIFTAVIPAGYLWYNSVPNVAVGRINVSPFVIPSLGTTFIEFKYGATSLYTFSTTTASGGQFTVAGTIDYELYGVSASSQEAYVTLNLLGINDVSGRTVSIATSTVLNASEDSTVNKAFSVVVRHSTTGLTFTVPSARAYIQR